MSGGKATGAQFSNETEIDNSLPGDKAAGQNVTDGIQRNSYSEVVIEEMRKRARVFVGT